MTAAERRKLLDEVRAAIVTSGVPPAEIARRSGVDKAALSRFLAGTTGLSVESIEKLAPIVGLEIVVKKKTRKK